MEKPMPKESIEMLNVAQELSAKDRKRILRKTDMCLLPIMAISYLFQFLDKTALSSTSILGLRSDIGLTGSDFSWASGIYYFGYVVASYPAAWIMVRFRVGKLIAVSVSIWGAFLMLTAVSKNAGGLLALRFFLGVSEAAIAPGLTIIISMWYTRSEQPLRHAVWFLGNSLAGVLGGILSYGIGHIETIAPWKAVFLIYGSGTMVWSIALYFFLPDDPTTARFLNSEDRKKAITRAQENMTGIKNNEFKWYQVREALLDGKLWFLLGITLCINIPNGAISAFSSIVINGLGFSTFNSLLLQSAGFGVQIVLVLLVSFGSSYIENTRTYWMAFNFSLSLTGCVLIRQLPVEMIWARYAGKCLTMGSSSSFPLTMSLSSGNFGGFTKKATVNAAVFVVYCIGNIIGPQLFIEKEEPSYQTGFLAIMICYALGFVLCFVKRFYIIWINKQRDDNPTANETAEDGIIAGLEDKTDGENLQFRYIY